MPRTFPGEVSSLPPMTSNSCGLTDDVLLSSSQPSYQAWTAHPRHLTPIRMEASPPSPKPLPALLPGFLPPRARSWGSSLTPLNRVQSDPRPPHCHPSGSHCTPGHQPCPPCGQRELQIKIRALSTPTPKTLWQSQPPVATGHLGKKRRVVFKC